MIFIKLYIVALPILLVLDALWIGLVAKDVFKQHVGHLMAQEMRWGAAGSFYLVYILGLVFFVIAPAIRENSWIQALLCGAFFGFIAYATYDLTNLATLDKWPATLAFFDMLWGSFVSGAVALITYWIGKIVFRIG